MRAIGVGLATEAVREYYREAVVVGDVTELPAVLIGVLGRVLVNGR